MLTINRPTRAATISPLARPKGLSAGAVVAVGDAVGVSEAVLLVSIATTAAAGAVGSTINANTVIIALMTQTPRPCTVRIVRDNGDNIMTLRKDKF
jgi:hypothetical protein